MCVEVREEQLRTREGENPHPPDCVWGYMCIDSLSLFSQKYNMIDISYKNNKRVSEFFLGKISYDKNIIFVLEN
jgi:hypothetical protein